MITGPGNICRHRRAHGSGIVGTMSLVRPEIAVLHAGWRQQPASSLPIWIGRAIYFELACLCKRLPTAEDIADKAGKLMCRAPESSPSASISAHVARSLSGSSSADGIEQSKTTRLTQARAEHLKCRLPDLDAVTLRSGNAGAPSFRSPVLPARHDYMSGSNHAKSRRLGTLRASAAGPAHTPSYSRSNNNTLSRDQEDPSPARVNASPSPKDHGNIGEGTC